MVFKKISVHLEIATVRVVVRRKKCILDLWVVVYKVMLAPKWEPLRHRAAVAPSQEYCVAHCCPQVKLSLDNMWDALYIYTYPRHYFWTPCHLCFSKMSFDIFHNSNHIWKVTRLLRLMVYISNSRLLLTNIDEHFLCLSTNTFDITNPISPDFFRVLTPEK